MTTVKTNKLAGTVKGRGGTILRSELSILLTETFLRGTARAPARPSRLLEGDHGGSQNYLGSQQGKVFF
jgi:hypothetical protein